MPLPVIFSPEADARIEALLFQVQAQQVVILDIFYGGRELKA